MSYKLRCSSYIVKPLGVEEFTKLVQTLTDYWFTFVTLPPQFKRGITPRGA
jgi:hypothetical protein